MDPNQFKLPIHTGPSVIDELRLAAAACELARSEAFVLAQAEANGARIVADPLLDPGQVVIHVDTASYARLRALPSRRAPGEHRDDT